MKHYLNSLIANHFSKDNIYAYLAIVLSVTSMLITFGCRNYSYEDEAKDKHFTKTEFENHSYLIYYSNFDGVEGITHDENCWCRRNTIMNDSVIVIKK